MILDIEIGLNFLDDMLLAKFSLENFLLFVVYLGWAKSVVYAP